jgi:hypothetical protein
MLDIWRFTTSRLFSSPTFVALFFSAAVHSAAGFHDNIRNKHCTSCELALLKNGVIDALGLLTGQQVRAYLIFLRVSKLVLGRSVAVAISAPEVGLKRNLWLVPIRKQ